MPYRWICLRLLFLLVLLFWGLGALRAEVSEPDSPALPADYDEARKAWTLTLPAAESNSSYEVFALYEGKVIGKLRVVSYPKQSYKLLLVPVNGQSVGDVSRLSQQLNSIYNKHGVSFYAI